MFSAMDISNHDWSEWFLLLGTLVFVFGFVLSVLKVSFDSFILVLAGLSLFSAGVLFF